MNKRVMVSLSIAIVALIIGLIIAIVCNPSKKIKYDSIEQLKAKETTLITAKFYNPSVASVEDDYWMSDTYELMCDGTLKISISYSLSGSFDGTFRVTDEELEAIYKATYAEYFKNDDDKLIQDGIDEAVWSLTYNDGAKSKVIYAGNSPLGKLEETTDILTKYKGLIPIELGPAHVVYASENLTIEAESLDGSTKIASINQRVEAGDSIEIAGVNFNIDYFYSDTMTINTEVPLYTITENGELDWYSGSNEVQISRGENSIFAIESDSEYIKIIITFN